MPYKCVLYKSPRVEKHTYTLFCFLMNNGRRLGLLAEHTQRKRTKRNELFLKKKKSAKKRHIEDFVLLVLVYAYCSFHEFQKQVCIHSNK